MDEGRERATEAESVIAVSPQTGVGHGGRKLALWSPGPCFVASREMARKDGDQLEEAHARTPGSRDRGAGRGEG